MAIADLVSRTGVGESVVGWVHPDLSQAVRAWACVMGQQFKTGLEAGMCISTQGAQRVSPVPE